MHYNHRLPWRWEIDTVEVSVLAIHTSRCTTDGVQAHTYRATWVSHRSNNERVWGHSCRSLACISSLNTYQGTEHRRLVIRIHVTVSLSHIHLRRFSKGNQHHLFRGPNGREFRGISGTGKWVSMLQYQRCRHRCYRETDGTERCI